MKKPINRLGLAGVEVVGPAKQNNGLHRQTASQASIEVKQLFPQVANPHGEPLPLVAAARERDRRARERLSRDPDFVFGRGPFAREWP